MIRILICAVFLLFSMEIFSQAKEKDSLELWTMFTIGSLVNTIAHELTAENWPIKLVHKTGDTFWVTADEDVEFKSEIEYIEAHNDSLWAQLKNRGFKTPKQSYEEQFQKERIGLEAALKLFNDNPVIKTYHERRPRNRFPNTSIKKLEDGIYQIEMWSFETENPFKTEKKEFIAKVDLASQQTTILKL